MRDASNTFQTSLLSITSDFFNSIDCRSKQDASDDCWMASIAKRIVARNNDENEREVQYSVNIVSINNTVITENLVVL